MNDKKSMCSAELFKMLSASVRSGAHSKAQGIPAKSFKKNSHCSSKKFQSLNTHASHDAQTQRRFSLMVA
ncbi:MAG: hypothetical protein KDA88_23775 [Planctomycetaceae bacterium]|nr:hypothetical protein [Planctomycetaceae bacterium]MCB9952278.1 hypothetical protein [Planctomycetaceae bacterium]